MRCEITRSTARFIRDIDERSFMSGVLAVMVVPILLAVSVVELAVVGGVLLVVKLLEMLPKS